MNPIAESAYNEAHNSLTEEQRKRRQELHQMYMSGYVKGHGDGMETNGDCFMTLQGILGNDSRVAQVAKLKAELGSQGEHWRMRYRALHDEIATLETRNRELEAELALCTEQLASATSRLNELDTPTELERMAESMKEVVKLDPGPDHYLLKEGDVIEAGDEFLNEENGEWTSTDCEGQHVGETTNFGAVVRFYRRRKPQTNG